MLTPAASAASAGPGGGHPLLLPQRGGECAWVAWISSLATGCWLRELPGKGHGGGEGEERLRPVGLGIF